MVAKILTHLFPPRNIWSAAKRGDIEAIRRFVAAGADADAKRDGWTPLHFAAEHGKIEAIRELAKLGVKIDARDEGGCTPLMLAKTAEQTRLLSDLGADVNKHDKQGGTALERAALLGTEEMVKLLLSQGADPNGPKGKYFLRGPLVAAVDSKNIKKVEALLQAGALVNPEPGKDSALAAAALRGRLDMVNLLLEAGADPNHAGYGKWTALMSSIRSKNADVVRALLAAAADVNIKALDEKTALDIALETKQVEIIKMLQEAGAKRGADIPESKTKAKEGETFWQLQDDSVLTAVIEPWPPSDENVQLKIEVSENNYNQSFSGTIEYRITRSENNSEAWLRLRGGENNEDGDVLYSVPIRLLRGANFIQFRTRGDGDNDFVYPEGWRVEVK